MMHKEAKGNSKNIFWENYLEDVVDTKLLGKNVVKREETSLDKQYSVKAYRVEAKDLSEIRGFLEQNHTPLEILVYAAWAILMNKYTYNDDIVFGIKTSGLLPLKVRLDKEKKLIELLQEIKKDLDTIKGENCSDVKDILKACNRESLNEIFNSIVCVGHESYFSKDFDLSLAVVDEENLGIQISYKKHYYEGAFIESIIKHCIKIMRYISLNLYKTVKEVEYLNRDELKELLEDFNETYKPLNKEESVTHKVEYFAEKYSNKIAIKCNDQEVTYAQLNSNVNRITRAFIKEGISEGNLVTILLERSIKMVEYILALWKIGAVYIPMDKNYPKERIKEVFIKSSCDKLITTEDFVDNSIGIRRENILTVEAIDEKMSKESSSNLKISFDINNLAYIIYTSGSTGEPKGVMVEHLGMMNHIQSKISSLEVTDKSIVSQSASHCFDISIWQFFSPLVTGATVCIYGKEILQDTRIFIENIIKDKVSIVQIVPVYFSNMLDALEAEDFLFHDLNYLVTIGEVLKKRLVERWFAKYPNIKLVNSYGPTEASDAITGYTMERVPESKNILIGQPIQNMNIYILDTMRNICPVNAVGQIAVSGVGVGRGYLNNKEKTKSVFYNDEFKENGSRIYLTGDLGRWDENGQLEIFGRIDHQVKLNGFRIELDEIEGAIIQYIGISSAVVVIKSAANGSKFLVAYYLANEKIDAMALEEHIGRLLPYYMLPKQYICLEEFPLLTSGKVDRKNLTNREISSFNNEALPSTETEGKLEEIWRNILGYENKRISINDNFFQIGGNSLHVTRVLSEVYKECGVKLSVTELFKSATIKELGRIIDDSVKLEYDNIPLLPEQTHYELSYYQKKAYLMYALDSESTDFNKMSRLKFDEPLEFGKAKDIFTTIINELVSRHEALRTRFTKVDGEIFQYIDRDAIPAIQFKDISQIDEQEKVLQRKKMIENELKRPFNLEEELAFRGLFIYLGDEEYELIYTAHGIVADNWSMDLLKEETSYYFQDDVSSEIEKIPPLEIQYKDFANWHNKLLADEDFIKKCKFYWERKAKNITPKIMNDSDSFDMFNDKEVKGYVSYLDNALKEKVNEFASSNKISIFTVIFSAFNLLRGYLTGEEEILCGYKASGRSHILTEGIVGAFENPLPIIMRVDLEEEFDALLERIENEIEEVKKYQDYPFEQVMEEIKVDFPEIKICFGLNNFTEKHQNVELGQTNNQFIGVEEILQYDLDVQVTEYKDTIKLIWKFNENIYENEEVKSMADKFEKLLSNILG